jgi:predicted aconitase with swiveling domain
VRIVRGRGITGGRATGPAIVTREPMNFTAAFTKPRNLLPGLGSQVNDRHHELYRSVIKGKVLIYPATIGSTGTSLALLERIYRKDAPAALVVGHADTLMVSGSILASVWFGTDMPIVEFPDEGLYELVRNGDSVTVDGSSGEIRIA